MAVVAALLLLTARPVSAQRFCVRNYTNTDGLPQRQAFAVMQDRAGYIWIGTYGGLCRYDGASFRVWDAGNGLPANTVLDVAEDGEGRLVVGTQSAGLCVREGERFTVIRQGPQLVHDGVQRITRAADGSLWIATEGGVTHRSAARTVHYTEADGLPSANVLKVLPDRRGRVWAATKRGLALLSGERWSAVHPEKLSGAVLRTLVEWGDDLLVGGDGVLAILRGGALLPFPAPLPEGRGREVYDAAVTPRGVLWLATADGALRWDGRSLERYGVRQGLVATGLHRVFVDREENVWFGSEAGVAKIGPSPFVGYTPADGLPHPFVRALGEDARGRVWVGTRAGAAVYDGTGFTTPVRGLPSERVYGFAPLPDGAMLVGTREGLAKVSEGRVVRTWGVGDGLPDPYVTCVAPGRDGEVFVGTAHGIALWRDGAVAPIRDPLLAEAYALALARDAEGRLWVGLRIGGVLVWDGRATRRLVLDPGLEHETVWAIARDARGRMWVGTNGFGALVVEGGLVTPVTTRDGLVNDYVWQVLPDADGSVWCYTSHGLDHTDGKSFEHYGIDDGLLDLEGSTGASIRQRNGDLWFGSGSGLSRFVPSRVTSTRVPPPVAIGTVTAGGRPVADGAKLAHDAGTLRVAYTALSFRAESAVRFRHRLLPADQRWSEPSPDRRIEFGRLAPGKYVLEVVARAGGGPESPEPARFRFQVEPPWWGTVWFRLTALLGAALAGIGLGALHGRRIELDRRRLAGLVTARTSELEDRNAELRRLATSDALTGVANRRHFMESLEIELKRASRAEEGGTVALVLLDLDLFKEVNDSHGHSAGDQVLAGIAARLRAAVRSTDLVARYGGEEFALLLPETRLAGAATIARKVRDALAGEPVAAGAARVTVTASFGVASLEGIVSWDDSLSRDLIDRADAALYRAKAAGRDRVELAPPR